MFNEVHSIHGHTLLLITKPSLQATALLQHLKQSLAITGNYIIFNVLWTISLQALLFFWI